jgi:hypothetical protein
LVIAVAVCLAESRGNPDAISATNDYGLWQINPLIWPAVFAIRDWRDPATNARMAYIVWKSKGWAMWVTYKHGSHLEYMDRARAAQGDTMINTDTVLKRIIDWQTSHGGSATDLVVKQHRAVFDAAKAGKLPQGTFLPEQCWAQMTGKEESFDLINEYPEDRLDYSNYSRWNMNKSGDCSSVVHWKVYVWTGRTLVPSGVNSYTESQWQYNKAKVVAYALRRAFDLPYFNFKQSQGRTVSHVATFGTNGRMWHTTSPTNPYRCDVDTWGASNRVGVVRFLTDSEYQSLFVGSVVTGGTDMIARGDTRTALVTKLQTMLMALGYDLPRWGADGSFGTETETALKAFQTAAKIPVTGAADDVTLMALAEAAAKLAPTVDVSEYQNTILALQAATASDKAAFGQIADLAGARR